MKLRTVPLVILLITILTTLLPARPFPPESPKGLWKTVGDDTLKQPLEKGNQAPATPVSYNILNVDALKTRLEKVPTEFTLPAAQCPKFLLPDPSGQLAELRIEEAPILAPSTQKRHPDIKSYRGTAPGQYARFVVTPRGIRGLIKSSQGLCRVEPVPGAAGLHRSTWVTNDESIQCACEHDDPARGADSKLPGPDARSAPRKGGAPRWSVGAEVRKYRIVIACTGEYAEAHSSSTPPDYNDVFDNFIARIVDVNAIYESEVSISFLIREEPNLVFLDPNTDPWDDEAGESNDISPNAVQAQFHVHSNLTFENYEVGHLFTQNGGGGTAKFESAGTIVPARARSNDDLTLLCHEIGHQFGAKHTWNATDFQDDQWHPGSAVEPGNGRTIMSYAGSGRNDANHYGERLPFFSWISAEHIVAHATTETVNTFRVEPTNNLPPSLQLSTRGVYTDGRIYIPEETPFLLNCTASDPDGDPVTVTWEGTRTGPRRDLFNLTPGGSPSIGFIAPRSLRQRHIPDRSTMLFGNPPPTFEELPSSGGNMSVMATARDGKWGKVHESLQIQAGPFGGLGRFDLTAPDGGEVLSGEITVTWETGMTELFPDFLAANVRILLSTNRGWTWSHLLAASTPNDGSANVVLPSINTDTARIKIEPIDNIFYTVSAADFSIRPYVTPTADWAPTIVRNQNPNRSRIYTIGGLASQPTYWRVAVTAPWITVNVPLGQNIEIPAGGSLGVLVEIDHLLASTLNAGLHEGAVHFIPINGQTSPPIEIRQVNMTLEHSYLVEQFSTANPSSPFFDASLPAWDLHDTRIRLVPDASANKYAVYAEPAFEFPFEPGGTEIPLGEDTEVYHPILLGRHYEFYGVDHTWMTIRGSMGAIQFTGLPDYLMPLGSDPIEILENFRGVAAKVPSGFGYSSGRLTYRHLADRTVVTWENVNSPGGQNGQVSNFQVIVSWDGTIEIIYLDSQVFHPATCGISSGTENFIIHPYRPADLSFAQLPEAEPRIEMPLSAYFSEGNSVSIPGISITDADADPANDLFSVILNTTFIFYGDVTVRDNVPGGVPSSAITGNGSTYVTIDATLHQLNTTFSAPNGVTFHPSSPTASGGGLQITANDNSTNPGGPRAGAGNTTLYQWQAAFNQPPTVELDRIFGGPIPIPHNGSPSLPSIRLTDDSLANSIRVTLSVLRGSLSLSDSVPSGLTHTDFQASPDGRQIEILAPLDRIDRTFRGYLQYIAATGYRGPDTLEILVDDLGSGGFGQPQTTSLSTELSIAAPLQNIPPTIGFSVASPVEFNGDSQLHVLVTDFRTVDNYVVVELSCVHGTLDLVSVAGGIRFVDYVISNGGRLITITAPLDKVQGTLYNEGNGGLIYTARRGFEGTDTLTAMADDLGFTGEGGPMQGTGTREIIVLPPPPNQPPNITFDEPSKLVVGTTPISLGEGQILLSDPDSGLNPVTTTFEVSAGTLALARDITGGLVTTDITIEHGGRKLKVFAPLGKLRTTLADRTGLIFLGGTVPPGAVTMTVTINDHGHFGTGGAWEATNELYLIKDGTPYDTLAFDLFGPTVASDVTLRDTIWGPTADPDFDGRPTAAEIYHGLNPLLRDGFGVNADWWAEVDPRTRDLVLYYRKSLSGAALFGAEPKWSTNLLNFHDRNLVTELVDGDAENGTEIWRSFLPGLGPPLFMRLEYFEVE